jgi:phage repressor protein C with HTH and peptisase S24 domain
MRWIDKLRRILSEHTQEWVAEQLGVSQPTVHRWRQGAEPRGDRRDAINELHARLYGGQAGEAALSSSVPLMGYLGAGAEVEPDHEQVPPEGLDQVDLPFPVPDEMIAFRVRGNSMLPVFKDGATIVVYREQKRPLESFYGEEAAVRTSDGRRFIKTIIKGGEPGTVNLLSWNDPMPIENVHLVWIGEIFSILPPRGISRAVKRGPRAGSL